MVLPIAFVIMMQHAAAVGEQRFVEVEMVDREKPAQKAILAIRSGSKTSSPVQGPSPPRKPQKLDRTVEQLMPLGKLVAENEAVTRRFFQARGSENEDLGRQAIDEIRNYARTLDPTLTHAEGARLIFVLEDMFPRSFSSETEGKK